MALRPLIAAIPHVGGSIEAIVTEPAGTINERRLQFMFAELHRQMRVLDGSDIDEDVLETEAWVDLVRQAVARAILSSDTTRLSAIARILAAAATGRFRLPDRSGKGRSRAAPADPVTAETWSSL